MKRIQSKVKTETKESVGGGSWDKGYTCSYFDLGNAKCKLPFFDAKKFVEDVKANSLKFTNAKTCKTENDSIIQGKEGEFEVPLRKLKKEFISGGSTFETKFISGLNSKGEDLKFGMPYKSIVDVFITLDQIEKIKKQMETRITLIRSAISSIIESIIRNSFDLKELKIAEEKKMTDKKKIEDEMKGLENKINAKLVEINKKMEEADKTKDVENTYDVELDSETNNQRLEGNKIDFLKKQIDESKNGEFLKSLEKNITGKTKELEKYKDILKKSFDSLNKQLEPYVDEEEKCFTDVKNKVLSDNSKKEDVKPLYGFQ
jgi:hypothetical protein